METSFRVGFCVSGGGHLFRAAAAHSEQLAIEPAVVILDSQAQEDLEEFCGDHTIRCARLPHELPKVQFNEKITSLCTGAKLDLLCLTFDRVLPPELVTRYRGRIINVHMGLLPAFKGLNALQRAVSQSVRYAGATIHEVDEEVDHGAQIAQCIVGVRRLETAEELGSRLFGLLRLMFLQVIAWYSCGRVVKDEGGHIWVRDAVYGEIPISPSIEMTFPER
jgi:phosphoribosylglycinamide formyltransferase-1